MLETPAEQWDTIPLLLIAAVGGEQQDHQALADAVTGEQWFATGTHWLMRVELYEQAADEPPRPREQADVRFAAGLHVLRTYGRPDGEDLVTAARAAMARATGLEIAVLPIEVHVYEVMVGASVARWASAGEDPTRERFTARMAEPDWESGVLPPGPDPGGADAVIDRILWTNTLAMRRSLSGDNTGPDPRELITLAAETWQSCGRPLSWDQVRAARGIHPVQRLATARLLIVLERVRNGQKPCPELDAFGGPYQGGPDGWRR